MHKRTPTSNRTRDIHARANATHDFNKIVSELFGAQGEEDITDTRLTETIRVKIRARELREFDDEGRGQFLKRFHPEYEAHDVNPPTAEYRRGTELFPTNRQLEAGGKGGVKRPQSVRFYDEIWDGSTNLLDLTKRTLGDPWKTDSLSLYYYYTPDELLKLRSEGGILSKFLQQIQSLLPSTCKDHILVSIEQGIDLNAGKEGHTSRTFMVVIACGKLVDGVFHKDGEEHWKCFTLHYKTTPGAPTNPAHLVVLEPIDNRVSQAKVSETLKQIGYDAPSRTLQRRRRSSALGLPPVDPEVKATDQMLTPEEIASFKLFCNERYGPDKLDLGRGQLALSIIALKTMGDSQFRRFVRKTIRRAGLKGIFHITTGDKRMFYLLLNELGVMKQNKLFPDDLTVFLEYTGTPGKFIFKIYNSTKEIDEFTIEDEAKRIETTAKASAEASAKKKARKDAEAAAEAAEKESAKKKREADLKERERRVKEREDRKQQQERDAEELKQNAEMLLNMIRKIAEDFTQADSREISRRPSPFTSPRRRGQTSSQQFSQPFSQSLFNGALPSDIAITSSNSDEAPAAAAAPGAAAPAAAAESEEEELSPEQEEALRRQVEEGEDADKPQAKKRPNPQGGTRKRAAKLLKKYIKTRSRR
jgi:hypothetical protein